MKSVVFVLIFWVFASEALYQVSANPSKELSGNNKDDITEKIHVATITDLRNLLREHNHNIEVRDRQFIEFIEQKKEIIKNQEGNFTLKYQEMTRRLENLREGLTNCSIEAAHKDGQIQDMNENLKDKDTQINLQNEEIKNLKEIIGNYTIGAVHKDSQIRDKNEQLKSSDIQLHHKNNEINELREQIKHKLKNEDTIEIRLKNLTEVIAIYKIEAARKDGQIQEKDTQINSKDDEIKNLKEQIESTQKELISLRYQTQSISGKLSSTKDLLGKYTYTEQCPNEKINVIFQFKIRGVNTFHGLCAKYGWMVIQTRYDGSETFRRSWNDYKEGFGRINGEFFFGLEKLHMMTDAQTYELHIQLEEKSRTLYALYSDFKIGSEKESYYLKSLGEYSGTAESSLNFRIQAKFSTFDRDSTGESCASSHGGGWWYSTCADSSPNGNYYKDGIRIKLIYWRYFRNPQGALTATLMMIRPKSIQIN